MRELLDRSAPIALYYQIAQILEQQIVEGAYKPNDYFSTEQELQDAFDVSRATIRKALERLEADDLIFRVTGKGIFVAPTKLKVVLPQLLSFSEEMKRRGMVPKTRLLGVEHVEFPTSVQKHLNLPHASLGTLVRRIRLGDDTPIVYSESFVPEHLGITVNDDFSESLYNLIHLRYGSPVESARHSIEGAVADEEIAEYLDVDVGFPLLRFRRTGYDDRETPIVFETGVARADKYSYEIYLKK